MRLTIKVPHWLIGWLFRGVWLVISWGVAAAKVGFVEARGPKRGSG